MLPPCTVQCIFLPSTYMPHIFLHSFSPAFLWASWWSSSLYGQFHDSAEGFLFVSPCNMSLPSQSPSLHHLQRLNSISVCHLLTPHMVQQRHRSDVPEHSPVAARQHSSQSVRHGPTFRAIEHYRSNARIVYSRSAHDRHAPVD